MPWWREQRTTGRPAYGFTVTGDRLARALVITEPSRLAGQIAARGEPAPPDMRP